MTAHRRVLLFRAGTVAVLAAGALIGIAAPAYAAATVVVSSAPDVQLTVGGGAQTVNIQVKNTGTDQTQGKVDLTIDIPGDLGLTIASKPQGCTGGGTHLDCEFDQLDAGATKNLPVGIAPPAQSSIPAGTSKQGTPGQVIITSGGSDTKSFNATLKAQAAAPTTQAAPTTVTEVSGTITDSATGKAVAGATVVLEDGAGKRRQLQTPTNGTFKFTGNDANPIAPGTLTLTAGGTGFDNETKQVNGVAGKANTQIKIGLPVLADTASAAPLPTANDPAIVEGQSANGVVPQNTATNNASNDGGGGVSWILIALGVLLVGFGIVAIVLLLRRRGDDDDEDENDEPAPRRVPGGVRPGGYGGQQGPDPTMVGAMGPAPTMISRGNNDATAIVRPGRGVYDDVPPDPYGAPPPGAGGYPSAGGYDGGAGFASGGYNGGGANGYGAQGRPAPGPAVDPYAPDYNGGGANGGYPDATQRYEAGTGGNNYGGGGANGYNNSPPTGGYGPGGGPGGAGGQGGYGGANGYEGGANGYEGGANGYEGGANGYGGGGQRDRGGYEGPPTTLGGFGGGDRGGYDGPSAGGGYGPNGGGAQGGPGAAYDDRGGYGQGAGGGYDGPSAGGGYAPGGGDRGGYGPNGGGGDYDGPYAGRGGYEPRSGYEPASGYERDGYERVPEPPRAGNGYGPNGGAAQAGAGYDDRGGYGQGAGGGYDGPSAGGGYSPGGDRGGYEQQQGGYDQRGGYGPNGGGPQGGPGGPGGPGGTYDDRGGYGPGNGGGGGDYDDARSQGRGGNRRSLDWLDD